MAWNAIDWAGREAILWPDNDESGQKAMDKLAALLHSLGTAVRMLQVPQGKPKGWDIADAPAEGEDPQGLLEAAKPRRARLPVWKP